MLSHALGAPQALGPDLRAVYEADRNARFTRVIRFSSWLKSPRAHFRVNILLGEWRVGGGARGGRRGRATTRHVCAGPRRLGCIWGRIVRRRFSATGHVDPSGRPALRRPRGVA
jgi:hypothetical protein